MGKCGWSVFPSYQSIREDRSFYFRIFSRHHPDHSNARGPLATDLSCRRVIKGSEGSLTKMYSLTLHDISNRAPLGPMDHQMAFKSAKSKTAEPMRWIPYGFLEGPNRHPTDLDHRDWCCSPAERMNAQRRSARGCPPQGVASIPFDCHCRATATTGDWENE